MCHRHPALGPLHYLETDANLARAVEHKRDIERVSDRQVIGAKPHHHHMQTAGLYTTDVAAIRERIDAAGLVDVFAASSGA